MLKPFLPVYGTSTSYSVRDGLLPVHPLVLYLPATLRASTLTMMTKYTELVKRPSTDVSLSLRTPAGRVLHLGPTAPSSDRTSHLRRPSAVTRSPTPLVEETTMKPARKAISTPRGEGTWGTTGGREQVWGPGLGSLLTMLPWFPRYPNLACTNEETPRGESPDGRTPRVPTATRPRHPGHRITVVGMCCVEGSLMKSEWGKQVRALVTYLVPSRPDDSPPSVVRRHHKHENADEHSASSMCPYILPALCPPNMFRSTWTCRTRHSSIDMFLSTRSCCSEGWGMRGALVHLHPTPAASLEQRPRHYEMNTKH